MAATANTGTVTEFTFGAVLQRVDVYVTGQWLTEGRIVRRDVALGGT
nr:hypothetical protein [Pseudomonas frederiksbergensis]